MLYSRRKKRFLTAVSEIRQMHWCARAFITPMINANNQICCATRGRCLSVIHLSGALIENSDKPREYTGSPAIHPSFSVAAI